MSKGVAQRPTSREYLPHYIRYNRLSILKACRRATDPAYMPFLLGTEFSDGEITTIGLLPSLPLHAREDF
jgi:hypothetical protein